MKLTPYQRAYAAARDAGRASMRAAGRTKMARADIAVANRLFAGLLWRVGAADGGFAGLSEYGLANRCAAEASRLNYDDAIDQLWSPPQWPEDERVAA